MKNIHILKGIFIAFLALQFFACENEPLEGDFPPREAQNDSIQTKFEALVDGVKFVATSYDAKISEENYLVLSGKKINGEKIVIRIPHADQNTFPLTGGEDDVDVGLYYGKSGEKPYSTREDLGGRGEIAIDSINTSMQRISGKFKIEGVRPELDTMGNPVLDENGDPIVHKVSVTEGVFANITYEVGTDPGSSGTNTGSHDFFAKVDGSPFDANSIKVIDTLIADTPIIQVHAQNTNNDLIRIDIPKRLGQASHDMQSMSNGTKLIGFYKAAEGDVLTSDPGIFTINEIDRERGILKASFAFTVRDPLGIDPSVKDITEGTLKIRFEGVTGGNDSFFAVVNDEPYLPSEIVVSEDETYEVARYNIATTWEDQTMEVSFPQEITEGTTYTMRGEIYTGREVNGIYSEDGGETNFTSVTGEFTVTLYDPVNRIVKGSFWFDATDSSGEDPTEHEVREGSFSVSIP